jgi:hypothetical protein
VNQVSVQSPQGHRVWVKKQTLLEKGETYIVSRPASRAKAQDTESSVIPESPDQATGQDFISRAITP